MHHCLQAAFELGPQRHHIAPLPLGDDRLLKQLGEIGIADEPLQFGHQPVPGHMQISPNAGQLLGSIIQHFPAIV